MSDTPTVIAVGSGALWAIPRYRVQAYSGPGAIATVQDGYCEPFEHEITGALDDLDAEFAAEPAT